jgi:hypothetical protein
MDSDPDPGILVLQGFSYYFCMMIKGSRIQEAQKHTDPTDPFPDRRIRIQEAQKHTDPTNPYPDRRIRIQEAQKHTDPTDPYPDRRIRIQEALKQTDPAGGRAAAPQHPPPSPDSLPFIRFKIISVTSISGHDRVGFLLQEGELPPPTTPPPSPDFLPLIQFQIISVPSISGHDRVCFLLQEGELPPPTTPLRPPIPFPSFGSNKTYTKRDMSLALEALRFLPFIIINVPYCL